MRERTVSTVRINSLEEPECDPDVDREDVEVAPGLEHSVDDRAENGTCTEDEDLRRMSVFSSETEGSGVLVVDLVDVLVERAPVKSTVSCDLSYK